MIIQESVLPKKHNVINYHLVRDAVVADILQIRKEYGKKNLAYLLTMVITGKNN